MKGRSPSNSTGGFLLIDKPRGPSSFEAIYPIRKLYKPLKVGFAGTLDPQATGLLLVAVGKATRLLKYLEAEEKVYRFDVIPGMTSDTYDRSGSLVATENPKKIPQTEVESALKNFEGHIEQMPPVYSALKVQGKRACDRTRAGETVILAPRNIFVRKITLVDYTPDHWKIEVTCSKGTYVRSIAHDLGQLLGVGAVCDNIRRMAIGMFSVDSAVDPKSEKELHKLEDIQLGAASLPRVILEPSYVSNFLHGRAVPNLGYRGNELVKKDEVAEVLAVFNSDEKLLGLGTLKENQLTPSVVLVEPVRNLTHELSP